jgi:hypothetical protein
MSFIINDLHLIARRGPFTGLMFSENAPKCSSTQAKVFGCYEKELEEVIHRSIQKNYEYVINVGCAEGYYAIGFALQMRNCQVFAFDIDPNQMQIFYETAILNRVSDRIQFHQYFTPDFITNNCPDGKKLFFCDCEGAELDIITDQFLWENPNMDHIVETHDFVGQPISDILEKRFQNHGYKVHKIKSISDDERALMFHVPELMDYDFEKKRDIIKEYRPCTMTWLYCTKEI